MDQVIDFSKHQKPVQEDPLKLRVEELQQQDAALVDPLILLMDQILEVFKNTEELRKYSPDEVKMKTDDEGNLILVDDEAIPERDSSGNCLPAGNPRQQFIASVVNVLESMIDHQTTQLGFRHPILALGRTMSRQISRIFQGKEEEHAKLINTAFRLSNEFITNVVKTPRNAEVSALCYDQFPASFIDYLSWNGNISIAADELQISAQEIENKLGLRTLDDQAAPQDLDVPETAEPLTPAESVEVVD